MNTILGTDHAMTRAAVTVPVGRRLRRPSDGLPSAWPQLRDWQLTECLGSGPVADVYLARPTASSPGGPVDYAIKVMRPEYEHDAAAVDQFRREAILGRRLSHTNLLPVLVASLDSPPLHFVMPRWDGNTLEHVLREHGPVVMPHALWVARQVADALGVLHREGWRHGDVHPKNISLAYGGHAMLCDLGCAMPLGHECRDLDRALTGTFGYMAPEQFTSRVAVGAASDVYSLGVTLFELLCGRPPFAAADPAQLTEYHLRATPPSIRTWLPQAPRSLAQGLTRMLAKDPARRPSTSGELQSLLTRLEIETFALRRAAERPV